MDKPKIHIIIPGGGVKGCFQAGFLYRLFKYYKNYFELYKIDGTSSGALNGYGVITGNLEIMKNNWLNASNMCDIFQNWSSVPIINIVLNKYYGYLKMGLFSNARIENTLSIDSNNNDNVDKFSCTGVNITTGKPEHIIGSDPNIRKYILASASPWLIVPPVTINDQIYTDGGLLETYPFHNIKNSTADIKIIIGFDESNDIPKYKSNTNILSFIMRLINICRYNHHNISNAEKFINDNNIIKIDTQVNANFITVNRTDFINGFYNGEKEADEFVKKYLKIEPVGNIAKNDISKNNSIIKSGINNISNIGSTLYRTLLDFNFQNIISNVNLNFNNNFYENSELEYFENFENLYRYF